MAKKKRGKKPTVNRPMQFDDRIRQLTAMKQALLDTIQRTELDRNSAQYKSKVRKLFESALQESIAKTRRSGRYEAMERLKLNGHYQKRRISAAVEYAPEFASRFEKKFPATDIEKALAELCSVPVAALPDGMEEDRYITLAIAIFILDELFDNNNIWEARLYIPSSPDLLCNVELPDDFYDSCYEDDLIKGMMYLIQNRCENEGDVFWNHVSAARIKGELPEIRYARSEMLSIDPDGLEEYEAKIRVEAAEMSCRERLDRIYSFIRPQIIERAEKRFEDKLFELSEMVLGRYEEYSKKYVSQAEETAGILDRLIKAENRLSAVTQRLESAPKNAGNPGIAPMNTMRNLNDFPAFSALGDRILNPVETDGLDDFDEFDRLNETIAGYADSLREADDRTNEAYLRRNMFLAYAINNRRDYDVFDEVAPEDIELMSGFRIDNPYEICFAYFYLLDSGSGLPWLAGLPGAVLDFAAELLPWTNDYNENLDCLYDSYDDEEDITEAEAETGDPSEEAGNTKADESDKADEADEEIPDNIEKESKLYSKDYTDYVTWYDEGVRRVSKQELLHLNFPQLLFNETRMNLPRNTLSSDRREKGLLKSGISRKNMELFKLLIEVCDKASCRIGLSDRGEPEPSLENEDDAEALKKLLSEKNGEIARLKQDLHNAENEIKKEREEAAKIQSGCDADRRELNELRELIYELQNKTEAEPSSEADEITLPYTAERRIVIFGGHDSWLRAIRPLLRNVRIIDPYTNPDINLIRNADVIWMQSNAMPHSYYNKIMDIIRQRKIPVKYFAYASAEKCARQLAEYDMKG